MRTLCFILLILFCTYLPSNAQKEWINWPGMPQGISFKNGKPESFPTLNNYSDYYRYQGSGVAYSDPTTGQIKFIATGAHVFNSNYDTVVNGYGLITCDGTVRVVPFPNRENKYYIFHTFPETNVLAGKETGLQTRCWVYSYINRINGGVWYSILDMDKNNGKGELVKVNELLQSYMMERIALVKHANGKDVWLVTHFFGTDTFTSFLINSDGIQPAVINNIGPVFTGNSSRCSGPLEASPDGKRLAATSGSSDVLEIYDFDNATGRMSNYKQVKVPGQPGSVCFSPDNSKLYVGTSESNMCGYRSKVYQVDLKEPDLQESLFKVYESGGSEYVSTEMTRAVDNKIYLGGRYVYSETEPTKSALFTIDYPNQPKNASTFKTNAFLAPTSFYSFPGLINDVVMQAPEAPVVNFNFPKEVSVCFGTYTLTAPAGYGEYRWSNGATTSSITVNEPGLYSVLAGVRGFNKPEAYGFTNVYSTGKNLNYGKDTTICPKTAFTLAIPYTYTNILWQDGDTSHIHRVPETSRKERVMTIDPNGCQTWDSICVYMKTNPSAEFGKDTSLCEGQTLTLQLQPYSIFSYGAVYSWQDGSTKDVYKVTRPGQYWGKATYEGCTVSDTINVSYVQADQFSLGKDSSLCIGDSLMLHANIPNAHYEWSTGATTQNILIKSTGSYWVKVNNGSCTVSDTIHITFNQPPAFTLGPDRILCDKDSTVLQTGIANARFLWQDGTIKDVYTVYSSGTYSVQVQKDGCTVKDTIQISYKPLPMVDLGLDAEICEGQKLSLQASHPSITDYLWQDGSAASMMEASSKGTYWVKVKGTNGCTNADTIIINIKPLPDFTLGIDTTLCTGESLRYHFNLNSVTYLWNDQTISGNYQVTRPGTYWLTITQNGCSRRDSIIVLYKSSPEVNLGLDTTLCEGAIKTLSAFNMDATYQWQDGSTGPLFEVSKAGKYSVAVHLNGCTRNDTIHISYINIPRFSLGNDTTLCNGNTITLQANVNDAWYLWQDGTANQHYIVKEPGVYSVTATNTCGSKTDEISINRGICKIIMPNAFTPNNDGKNDVFRIKYPQFIKTFRMTIYNRWGEIIYENKDPYKGWNGMYKTLPQPEGNYIWMISIVDNDGISSNNQGNVYLMR